MGPRQNITDGGYNVSNHTLYTKTGSLRPTDVEALTCGLCSKILREPMQLITCGCRFCNVCIQKVVLSDNSSSGIFTCTDDGEPFTRSDIRKDKGCMKEIQLLEVDCPSPSPCGWRGCLVSMEDHEQNECPNAIVTCPKGCGARYLRSLEADHKLECSKREENCEHCSATVPRDELQDHYSSCPEHPMSCDFCNESIPHRREFERHLEVCTECELNCPMATALGCSFKGKRSEMSLHTMNCHLLNVLEKVSELSMSVITIKATNEDLRKQLREKDKKIDELESRVAQLESSRSYPQDEIIERDGVKLATQRGMSSYDDIGTLSPRDSSTSHVIKKSSPSSNRRLGYDDGRTVSGLTHMLRETVEKHDNQISRLQENMQGLQQNITQYSIAVDELRLRQDVQDVKTTHGVFIWKIPDIRRRYRDALDRKTISLYSPPFQTSPHGYRMCIRVYLNGDGAGKGTYISLFFVLMRSEHDDLLSFPFKQSVRFSLLNQSNPAESISEAFAPDLNSQSFQKPQGEMNVASGFPKFARQTVLHDERFTKGNVIYIKAKVDLTGLSLD